MTFALCFCNRGFMPILADENGDKFSLQYFTTTARQEIVFNEMKKIVRGYLDLWYV